jgi:FAD/FMN-containing dehydrogenase
MNTKIARLSGWGRYPIGVAALTRPELYREFVPSPQPEIVRGQGRSYGDATLNRDGRVTLSERINRFLDFNPDTGLLRAEAGLTLAEVLKVIVPHGWFLPVTPGTQFASLGGCIAADVHGKNHLAEGSFSQHVEELELILASGERARCGHGRNEELFWATTGGMGLTGLIGEVTLRLQRIESACLVVDHRAAMNLDAIFAGLEDDRHDAPHRVAWLDGMATAARLGRGVVMTAYHARPGELPPSVRDRPYAIPARRAHRLPVDLPSWFLNRRTIGAFNYLYYRRQGRPRGPVVMPYEQFFYPLDAMTDWNRLYGKRGFLQYQCVIPERHAYEGIRALLETIAASQRASFLAVLKRLGDENRGGLTFALRGYTLALDFPLHDDGVFSLLDTLDETVLRFGGRVYLAKDARMRPSVFRAMYPHYREWLAVKRRVDPDMHFVSDLARRLHIGSDA